MSNQTTGFYRATLPPDKTFGFSQVSAGTLDGNGNPVLAQHVVIDDIASTLQTPLDVSIHGYIDTNNTTTTPLAGDAVFTGTATDITHVATISIIVFSDQASAAGGLSFQQSGDGTNWDSTDDYTYTNSTGKVYNIPAQGAYFRVVYTNGSTIQGAFRLTTILRTGATEANSHRIGDAISDEDDAGLNIAVLTAKKPNGDYVNIDATVGGNLKNSVEEFDPSAHQYTSFVSTANSSTTPLSAAAVFTGTAEDGEGHDSITVAVATDQDGTLTIQFSTDGTNWDSTLTRYYRVGSINPPYRFTLARRYFRVTFTNTSASNQTYFRLQTIKGVKTQLNIPNDATMSQRYDAFATRPSDYRYEVARGLRQGRTTWNKWGYNEDIDTAAAEVVWPIGGSLTKLTTASTLSVVSTSASDTSGGTGANSIIIYGIDANRLSQTEVVTMNGLTPVVTANTWLGVNRMAIFVSGSAEANVGTIDATATTGGSTQAQIPVGEGSTQQAIFFTQAKHTALMDWLLINVNKVGGSAPIVTVKCFVFSFVSGSRYEVYRQVIDSAVENTVELRPTHPFVVGEKSVVYFEMSTTVNNTIGSIRFSLIEAANVDA